jgi:hypothetical protein
MTPPRRRRPFLWTAAAGSVFTGAGPNPEAAMRRLALLLTLLAAGTPAAEACSFCGEGFARRQPLRGQFAAAKVVLAGTLKNPKPAADGLGGTTELHVTCALKTDPAVPTGRVVVVPRYLPVVGDTPPEYVVFFDVTDGKLDPVNGVEGGAAVAQYVRDAVRIPADAPDRGLGFFFRHLDSPTAAASNDAFVEFARASDADLARAVPALNRVKVRAWLADPNTPNDRIGVYAMLLGLCGTADDAGWLAEQIAATPRGERVTANLGGLLAGLILLDPARGWPAAERAVAAADRPFSERLSVIGTLRYFQATRPRESRAKVLACYRRLIEAGELADLAADDLRRWGWWDLSAVLFERFGRPTHAAPAVRRATVRYALGCPDADARAFVAAVRAADPALVARVEEGMRLYDGPRK